MLEFFIMKKLAVIVFLCAAAFFVGFRFVQMKIARENRVTWTCGIPNAATFTFSADYDAERFALINQSEKDIDLNDELATVCVYNGFPDLTPPR